MTIKVYVTPDTHIASTPSVSAEDLNSILKVAREHFKSDDKQSLVDHLIYNAVRNKPMFKGIRSIKQNYIHQLAYENRYNLTRELLVAINLRNSKLLTKLIESDVDNSIVENFYFDITRFFHHLKIQ